MKRAVAIIMFVVVVTSVSIASCSGMSDTYLNEMAVLYEKYKTQRDDITSDDVINAYLYYSLYLDTLSLEMMQAADIVRGTSSEAADKAVGIVKSNFEMKAGVNDLMGKWFSGEYGDRSAIAYMFGFVSIILNAMR